MISLFINSFKVSFVEQANTFIYFLKRLPILGKKIPDNLYKRTHAKLIIGVIRSILGVFGGFIGKVIYLGIMIILPSYLITHDITKLQPAFIHIFFFLSLVMGPLMKTIILDENNIAAFNMITLMKADARDYYLGELLYRNITNFIYFVIPVMIIDLIIGYTPLRAIMLIGEVIAFRLIGEWLQLFIYDKTEVMLKQKGLYMSAVIIGGLFLAYGLPLLGYTIDFNLILFNSYVVITVLGIGVASYIYIWRYKRYTQIAKVLLTKENLYNIENIKNGITFATVKIDEERMSREDLNTKQYDEKQGYEYLNSLFFLRFRRIMINPIKQRIILIFILLLIALYFVFFMASKRGILVNTIKDSIPMLVFIMYSISTGERICKAMFYNCDVSLLRYAYYREANVILSNFTSRLKRVVIINIIPALTLCVAIACIIIASDSSQLIKMIPLFLCIICLACFFSIHHLFMYYVLQPYTEQLTVKSPLFKIINTVMYFASYLCLQIRTSSYYFTTGIIITTVVYMAVALIVIYRVAPKTFKLK
ncbi:SoxR reducing system RseC family protein [Clostridium algoriphilum]|uniref:SoxR reducing system RseC family protein n=1 Tax=Clostridium algoriphilum TaxID=198347 RepID=UPI001CF367C8|nr:SoxR reducing system RseC family protein [Clostridium algoriphilum]MCB2295241.1 SoxR reducing system RseC family protein [Clostridium algoriphilum]